jgi:hypothetical protein
LRVLSPGTIIEQPRSLRRLRGSRAWLGGIVELFIFINNYKYVPSGSPRRYNFFALVCYHTILLWASIDLFWRRKLLPSAAGSAFSPSSIRNSCSYHKTPAGC